MLPLDVNSDESVEQAFHAAISERGQIDVLVNNAGISKHGAVEDLALEVFRRIMETNYFGALRCIKAVLPAMRERRSGCIVNVTSLNGRIVLGANAAYSASKFALEALSEALAQELKTYNVRVAIVEPGVIQTPIFEKATEDPLDSHYPHERRLRAVYAASLRKPVSPFLVAEEIRRIVENDDWQLRHPVGPDALPLLKWRSAITDEEWVARNAVPDDDEWYRQINREIGLDARPFGRVRSIARGV